MIDTTLMTKAWAPDKQESSLKVDKNQTLTPEEQQKVLGGESLGTYLNKIANPHWVAPAKIQTAGNDKLDKNAFLKLFLAQLKNQDPTNPMKGHQLAAELAQFTSLEKLTNIDSALTTMSKKNDANARFDALALIGKGISGDSSVIDRTSMTGQNAIEFKLLAPATKVDFSIRNSAGQEVKKFVAKNLKSGTNKILWDGKLDNGLPAPEGEYNVVISAENSAGQKIGTQTAFHGVVTGVNFTPAGPILLMGKQTVKLKDVKQIFDLSPAQDHVATVNAKAVKASSDGKPLASAAPQMGGNLQSVGMTQGLINKLGKEAEGHETTSAEQAANVDQNKLNL